MWQKKALRPAEMIYIPTSTFNKIENSLIKMLFHQTTLVVPHIVKLHLIAWFFCVSAGRYIPDEILYTQQ